MIWKVQLSDVSFNKSEYSNIKKILNSKWISMGSEVKKFEENFINQVIQSKNYKAIACSSCTAAIHLSMMAIGIKKNDEVIVPSISFISAINVLKIMGAKPILADITSVTNLNICPKSILKLITKKTKAIMVMHYAGFPCDMKKIKEICSNYNLYLIEDAAHAPGAKINSKSVGTFGDLSCFSFFSNKNITTGEGGMVVVKDKILEKRIRSMRSHGMTTMSLDRHNGRSNKYDIIETGLNYRMDEIRAAIGNSQLKKLSKFNLQREKLFYHYIKYLPKSIKVINLNKNKMIQPAYHLIEIILPKNGIRDDFINYLKYHKIQSSIHYLSYNKFNIYKKLNIPKRYIMREIINHIVTLPLHPNMSKKDVEFICLKIGDYFNE